MGFLKILRDEGDQGGGSLPLRASERHLQGFAYRTLMGRGLLNNIKERRHYFWLWKIHIQFPLGNIVIGNVSIGAAVFFGCVLNWLLGMNSAGLSAPWRELRVRVACLAPESQPSLLSSV